MCEMELKKDIEGLYDCVCDIYFNEEKLDDSGLIIGHEKIKAFENINCRLSYKNGTRKLLTAEQTNIEGKISQSIKLFLSNDLDIKAGSEIVVFKNNKELKFKHSGISSIYSNHQEIVLSVNSEA